MHCSINFSNLLALNFMMKFLFTLLIVTVTSTVFAQHQEREVLLYNIGFGGITAGIGAVINKPKNINWKKAFVKAFWQGSIGGCINYAGKKTLYQINKQDNKLYAWPAKILHAAGVSITENAALNEPFLQNWNIAYGLVRFDFSINGKKKFKARFLPEVLDAIYNGSKAGSFDFKNTLLTGNLIYTNKENALVLFGDEYVEGVSFSRSIAIGANWALTNRIIAHEIVHLFQYEEYQIFNTWLKPLEKKIKSKAINKVFSKYIYFDVPYFWLPYTIERYNNQHYYRNFYEFEAERFSTNKFVPR
jgi:hypothetical protein